MQQTHIENIAEILRNKALVEKELNIRLSNRGKNVFVDGKPEDEFIALEVLEAVNVGFSVNRALQLKFEGMIMQTLNIKSITKRNDLERVRGRIIGTQGKTLKTLHNLTNCDIAMNDNCIGIIGDAEDIEDAVQAVTSLVHGSKQGNVYARLEKQKKRKRIENKNLRLAVEKE